MMGNNANKPPEAPPPEQAPPEADVDTPAEKPRYKKKNHHTVGPEGTRVRPEEALPPPVESTSGNKHHLFEFMTRTPNTWLFLVALPILWIIFIAVGWSKEDIVETEVNNIWTEQRSSYKQDNDYAAEYGRDQIGATSFAALAVARDGGNIFTLNRLEEIRARMEETEKTTIEYKGEWYTWDDVCAKNDAGSNTTYKFPCARLSPMDFFREARWFFDDEDRLTWYQEVVRKLVIAPRIPRFGILTEECSNLTLTDGDFSNDPCNGIYMKRLAQRDPMKLFSDIGSLEMNDPCKQCIETKFEDTIEKMFMFTQGVFRTLVKLFEEANTHPLLVTKYNQILGGLDRQAVIDFYSYMVTRGIYADLGAPAYKENYGKLQQLCAMSTSIPGCPLPDINLDQAKQALKNHADHAFSSTVTSGSPLPLWGKDGEGNLLEGNSPVSGSGVFLGGEPFSTAEEYLDLANIPLDPTSNSWQTNVETDPVYRWFMAGVTDMDASCGNGNLKGATEDTVGAVITAIINPLITQSTKYWCTEHNTPYMHDEKRTQQHFARMWYDLLIDSQDFLGLVQGTSDPYTWTMGQGCGYRLGGQRFAYNSTVYNETENQPFLMGNASGQLYYIDEGTSLGPIDRNLLLGGTEPADFNETITLTKVSVVQTIYPALLPADIVKRIGHCNRPGGLREISIEDAEEILFRFKEAFEGTWTKGWDQETGSELQFVGFFDDSGVIGTTGRMLEEITLSNEVLMAVSIVIIAAFSILFLFSFDPIESKIMITIAGVILVVLAFFASVGFGLMVGIKINVTIAWTLPFIMLGLGVDDMYIILQALKKQRGYAAEDFLAAMKEVFVPVTMTSVVNGAMFAIMNVNDIPAVYLTAQVALISVIFLYLTIVFCFPAYCWLDMRRQAAGYHDVLVCKKEDPPTEEREKPDLWAHFYYDSIYKPLVLGTPAIRICSHIIIWLFAIILFAVGIWGLTEREVGLGLEDFFPEDNQASQWAQLRTEQLASWSIQMNWGALDYAKPDTQMRMIQQFEQIVDTSHVAEIDTKNLWLADFLVWTTDHCTENFDRANPDVKECGKDQMFDDDTTCASTWVPNSLNLREKAFSDEDMCIPYEGGICRPSSQMHDQDLTAENDVKSWCPVVQDWSDEKFGFCLKKWREFTGGSGGLVLLNETGRALEGCTGEFKNDETVAVPIPYSKGPTMFAFDLFSHEITLDMLEETREICDNDPELHCWMTGIPYDYWSQYVGIFGTFGEIAGISIAVGFIIAFLFLYLILMSEKQHAMGKIVLGSLTGSLMIAVTNVLSLITVAGLSILADVQLTGFSNMSFVLSVGFSVEYSVHIIARWLRANPNLARLARVEHTMSFLTLPTFMSFVSSVIGVACLAFTEFEFNQVFFFRPLIILMPVTYFYGCWWLPSLLTYLDFDFLKLGVPEEEPPVMKEEVDTEGNIGDDVGHA